MGVTIHFEGRLRDEKSLQNVLHTARVIGRAFGWPVIEINQSLAEMVRVIEEEEVTYVGAARGIEMQPHPDCDPFRIVFGGDLFLQEFVKTQFAGAETHVRVVELLREIEPYFARLFVDDEGEFWDTLDRAVLAQHIENTNAAITSYVAEHPGVQVKVRLPSGYIVDIMK